ncbi:hypothetical protein MMC22_008258 [Lobaria immixta]|nr:hypothetical protein [Lobaria immixta]
MEQPLLQDSNAQYKHEVQQSFTRVQQFSRWFLSVLCVAFLLASLAIYQTKGILTSTQVKTFNAITTTLGLVLNLCFFDAFKDLAKVSRWRILARQGWNDLEKKLIRDLAKLSAVALNLSAQAVVALISQVYSMQGGTNWNETYIRPARINASDLSCYYHHRYDDQKYVCETSPEVVQGIVHAYGEHAFGSLSDSNDCVNYTNVEDVLRSGTNPKYYCRRTPPGQQEFAYRFLEYNPQDHQRTYPFMTDRVITASAGQCYQYSLLQREKAAGGRSFNFTYANKTFSDSILIPAQIDNFLGTVYIYRGLNTPQNATRYSCGPRCIWMWAYRNGRNDNFYQCPITVNSVQNASQDAHRVSDDIARLAASSIGLQGGNSLGHAQFQFYPIATDWDIHSKKIDHVGSNMAEFALGSIATMATNNPSIQISGTLPTLGRRLEVTWAYAIALLVIIAGVHSALLASAIYADWWNRTHLLNGVV